MASLDNALIAHIERNGERFEIYVDPDESLKYRLGQSKEIRKVLITEEIYKDIRKGEKQTETAIKKAFDTLDPYMVAEYIFKHGVIPFTTKQKKELSEQKLKSVIDIILRGSIDPRTKAPHTRVRIENAIEKVRIHIDPFKDAESQVDEVVKALRGELPIVFKTLKIAVKIPAEYSQRIYGALKEYNMSKEEWTNKGELVCLIEIPAGVQGEFYDRINKLTHGNIETKVIE